MQPEARDTRGQQLHLTCRNLVPFHFAASPPACLRFQPFPLWVELRLLVPRSLFPAPAHHPFRTATMPSPTPLFHQQLEASLRLVLAFLPTMATNDLLLVGIRLTEANIVVRQTVVEREAAAAGKLGVSSHPHF